MGMTVAVGCPVKNREWILPFWFDHIERAFQEIDVEPVYVFVASPSMDRTYEVLANRVELGFIDQVVSQDDDPCAPDRGWNDKSRYHDMALFRNRLLSLVREIESTYFLSIDSDILIAPGVLPNLIEDLQTKDLDAVASKCYMSATTFDPNYAMLFPDGGSGLIRNDAGGVFVVDAIMALKLMTPGAYRVDYEFDYMGEDIGWSRACRRSGLHLGWDGRIASKHVMGPDKLDLVDGRCGY